ncbi:pirin family protein [Streptomyces sp. SL13]|uniref:Pirin family protein n=1 Tax=Streptantibioticus silvisoli TaxID=2705255 RepID=A0AA90GZ79_9ACTN|nr:pirin family protein [Streptantibioticus silvisoli]MDI5968093.1 pirin family protein [Streptantibioticus silvisoli]
MVDVTRAGRRHHGGDPPAGITTRHAFSFGGHYDPGNLRHGPLTACNEEWLAPGAGFAEHTHREVEIVTWVLEGALEHRDDAGHHTVVPAGSGQWLSAGAAVRHTEANADAGRPCRFVQMWLEPARTGGPAAHGTFGPDGPPVRPPRLPGATLTVARERLAVPAAPFGYLHVLGGAVRLGGTGPDGTLPDGPRLEPGDAARLTGAEELTAEPDAPDTAYLLWSLPAAARP